MKRVYLTNGFPTFCRPSRRDGVDAFERAFGGFDVINVLVVLFILVVVVVAIVVVVNAGARLFRVDHVQETSPDEVFQLILRHQPFEDVDVSSDRCQMDGIAIGGVGGARICAGRMKVNDRIESAVEGGQQQRRRGARSNPVGRRCRRHLRPSIQRPSFEHILRVSTEKNFQDGYLVESGGVMHRQPSLAVVKSKIGVEGKQTGNNVDAPASRC